MRQYHFGTWVESTPLNREGVETLCATARQRQLEMRDYPVDKIFRLFDSLAKSWKNPEYPRRKKLLETLPAATGFSKEMIALGLEELVWTLDRDLLQKKMDQELRGLSNQEWKYDPKTGTKLQWEPLGTILHILSGNVFLVGIGSLVEGLITGNVNVIKVSSNETLFMPELVESILEHDKDGVVSHSIALVEYRSSEKEIISAFKTEVDGIVVWGGEDAVRAYRNDLPARTKCIVFGPKLSVAVVTHGGLTSKGVQEVAKQLAWEVSIWDQNACTAPQICFVETEERARELAVALAGALKEKAVSLPAGPCEINAAVEIQKLRGVWEIAEFRGEGLVRGDSNNVDWTVGLVRDQQIEASPLHRTIRVVPFQSADEVVKSVSELKGYIQTIGLAADRSEAIELSEKLSRVGALRVLEVGQMAGGEIDDPHDGAYDLSQYGHFVFSRVSGSDRNADPSDMAASDIRAKWIDARLRRLVDVSRRSPFYHDRLNVKIDTTADLVRIPVLTRDEMEQGMRPGGYLSTGADASGGYVTRSGGSSGKPKFSIYNGADWEALVAEATKVLRAAGLERGDRIANCMLAGDLYGSFVSFDHINSRVGATTFAFAGHVEPEVFLDAWRKFNINVIEAMPTVLIPLVKVCKQLDPSFALEKVIYAGTPLSPTDRKWLFDNIGVKRVSSIIGANDGGQLAYQCQYLEGAFHHLVDDFNFVEILNEENQPVKEGEAGKIVITSLKKVAFPLIRYEVGDAARIVSRSCKCGRTTPVIEYLGRSDDGLCIGLLNLRYRDVLSIVKRFPVSVLQLVGTNSSEGETLVLRCEVAERWPALAQEIQDAVKQDHAEIRKRLEDRNLLALDVQIYDLGSLPRDPRTGKVKVMLDERR